MRSCMENCAISRREIDEKYLIYSRNYSIPHRNEEKSEFCDADFFGFNSKNELDYIIKNTKVFYYVQRLVDVVAAARSNDAQCWVTFLEKKRRRISKEDNWSERLLFVSRSFYIIY